MWPIRSIWSMWPILVFSVYVAYFVYLAHFAYLVYLAYLNPPGAGPFYPYGPPDHRDIKIYAFKHLGSKPKAIKACNVIPWSGGQGTYRHSCVFEKFAQRKNLLSTLGGVQST